MKTALVMVTGVGCRETHPPMSHMAEAIGKVQETRIIRTRIDQPIMEESREIERAIKELKAAGIKQIIIAGHSKGADAVRQADLSGTSGAFINLSSAPHASFLPQTREAVEKAFGVKVADSVFEGVDSKKGQPKMPALNLVVESDPIALAEKWVGQKEHGRTAMAEKGDETPIEAHNWASERLNIFLGRQVRIFLKSNGFRLSS